MVLGVLSGDEAAAIAVFVATLLALVAGLVIYLIAAFWLRLRRMSPGPPEAEA